MLSIPRYLQAASVQDNSIRYEWDDWKPIPAARTPDEKLVARLSRVSQRAVLAFGCGTAEWIVYRFGLLCDDPAPWNFLEAAWAMLVDVRYCGYGSAIQWQDYARDDWTGPVKKPIKTALVRLESAIQLLAWEGHTDPSVYTAIIFALTSYVMTDPTPLRTWSSEVLSRLEFLYPRNDNDPLGDVVPREAIDPEFMFDPAATEELINRFFRQCNYQTNKFLSPPEGMREHFEGDDDFVGTPYVFDMDTDRRLRRERKYNRHEA
jgi:hypothetical protein